MCLQPKLYAGSLWQHTGALLYSPVELAVVIMCLPPEVEPDKQETEGKEEDQGPQKLPLHTQTIIYVAPPYLIITDLRRWLESFWQ